MIDIRRYTAADRPACQMVYYRAVHEGAARFYDDIERNAWAPSPTPDYTKPDTLRAMNTWVAEQDSDIIGFMSVEDNGHLDLAFVLPEVMGKGVSDALLETVTAWAREHEVPRLYAETSLLARRFFARKGWRVSHHSIYHNRGVDFDQCHMSLDLSGEGHDRTL